MSVPPVTASVAPLATVIVEKVVVPPVTLSVPPLTAVLPVMLGEPPVKSSSPAVTVSVLAIVSVCATVAMPEALFTTTALKDVVADPPMLCAPLPLNVMFAGWVTRFSAALAVQLPATLKATLFPENAGSTSNCTLKNCVVPMLFGIWPPSPTPANSTVPPLVALNVP